MDATSTESAPQIDNNMNDAKGSFVSCIHRLCVHSFVCLLLITWSLCIDSFIVCYTDNVELIETIGKPSDCMFYFLTFFLVWCCDILFVIYSVCHTMQWTQMKGTRKTKRSTRKEKVCRNFNLSAASNCSICFVCVFCRVAVTDSDIGDDADDRMYWYIVHICNVMYLKVDSGFGIALQDSTEAPTTLPIGSSLLNTLEDDDDPGVLSDNLTEGQKITPGGDRMYTFIICFCFVVVFCHFLWCVMW